MINSPSVTSQSSNDHFVKMNNMNCDFTYYNKISTFKKYRAMGSVVKTLKIERQGVESCYCIIGPAVELDIKETKVAKRKTTNKNTTAFFRLSSQDLKYTILVHILLRLIYYR